MRRRAAVGRADLGLGGGGRGVGGRAGLGVVALLVRGAAFAACLLGGVAPGAVAQTLRVALDGDADALDPTQARTYLSRVVFASLCDKLFDIDAKLAIVGQLAEAWEWADSRTLVVRLRPGVTFHDGRAVDAAAVKFSMERHRTMPGSTRRAEIDALERVEIVDPRTVRMVLRAANAPFVSLLADRAGMLVPPGSGADFAAHPVCTGPFRFVERVPQDRIVLERYAGYWNAAAIHFDRVVFHPIVDNSVRVANLRAGAVDFAEGLEPSDLEAIRGERRLRVEAFDGLGYASLTFNIANGKRARTPMMRDARVRQAFALSLDRAAMNQVVFGGVQTPVAQAVPPGSPFYDASVGVPGRDVARARALLRAAGVTGRLAVELTVTSSPVQRQLGEVMQAMAAEAGFDVTLRTLEFVSSLKATTEGDYEVYLLGWSGRVDEDGNVYNGIRSGGPLNATGYASAESDGLLERARAVTDIAVRRELYGRLARRLLEDVPMMYLWTPKTIMAMDAKLTGYVPVPDGLIRPQGMEMTR
jgi:peptide/nickel transport system substrate-binding protein